MSERERVDLVVGLEAIGRQLGTATEDATKRRLDWLGVPYARLGDVQSAPIFTTRRHIQEAIDRALAEKNEDHPMITPTLGVEKGTEIEA